MNSKNNRDRPVKEREYFDRPFSYMHQGFVFSPIHKRPVELSQNKFRSKAPTGSPMEHLSTMGASFYSVKNPNVLPVTNGLNNEQLMQSAYRKPHDMSTISAQISNDFGKIPFLREREGRRKSKMSKSVGRANVFSMTGQLNMNRAMV